jgi:coenzyme F420-reducing hydrogenase delta subunit
MSVERVVLVGCAHSAGEAIKELTAAGRNLPADVEWVSVPCGSTIDELYILRAFESGAGRVLVLACYRGACRSVDGSLWAEKRVQAARVLLQEAGIAGWRLKFANVAPTMGPDLLQWLEAFHEPLERLTEVEVKS